MEKYTSSQKLWRVLMDKDEYYYEIKLAGIVIDRIKIEEPSLTYLKTKGLI